MVAYNFQGRFAVLVESGAKPHTIREKARCKPGDRLQLYTGMRTKACRKLLDAICTGVTAIVITKTGPMIDDKYFYVSDPDELARNDGFADWEELYRWFVERYKRDVFHGYIIKWKELKNEA